MSIEAQGLITKPSRQAGTANLRSRPDVGPSRLESVGPGHSGARQPF